MFTGTVAPLSLAHAAQAKHQVFIVQDILCDELGQKVLAKNLSQFLSDKKIDLILVPAALGDVSLAAYRQDVPLEIRQAAVDHLLPQGRITTAEILSMTGPGDVRLWGVEDPNLYARSLQVTGRLLQRSSFFKMMRQKMALSPPTPALETLARLLDGKMTADDRMALETYPERFEWPGDARFRYAFHETVSTLLEYEVITESRIRFMARNLRRVMDENKRSQAVLLMHGAMPDELRKQLEENQIGLERASLPSLDANTSKDLLAKRLFEEAGMTSPADYRDSPWKSSFLSLAPLALRPARESLALDLLRDKKPLLWDLGEAMKLSPEKNLRHLLDNMSGSSADIFRQDEASVKFSWTRGLFPASVAVAGEGSSAQILNLWHDQVLLGIEHDYDKEKYDAFKEMARKLEIGNKLKEPAQMEPLVREYIQQYEKALLEAEKKKQTRKNDFKSIPWVTRLVARAKNFFDGIPSTYKVDPAELARVVAFVRANRTGGGMPLSYKTPKDFWTTFDSSMDEVDSAMERLLVEHSVSIYDAALWQMALMVSGNEGDAKLVDDHTRRLLSGTSGDLVDIRAYDGVFLYGDEKKVMKRDQGYFFRIIADEYIQSDPLGVVAIPDFPNFALLHHEDWKPITGEQAWATIIGPIQTAHLKYGGKIPAHAEEMKLAMSILDAVEAMQAPNGAIYHVPAGTHGKSPYDISNENNCSMLAALRILHEVVKRGHPTQARRVEKLMKGQLEYFKNFGFERQDGVFNQGGFYLNGSFIAARIFAADCQTWAINALTPEWIDETFGHGTSYRLWQRTKDRVGYYDDKDVLRGIGFTDGHEVHSVEWTCGAILSARLMARFYGKTEPAWTEELKKDALTMRYGLEQFKTTNLDGSVAYLYANKRYFIPWGWWANPIPSMASSAWVVLIDRQFDPFVLGGGPDFLKENV